MVVQTASPVASISTENDEFYISANVSASDRSRIEEGNKASIEVSGLQQNIYGTIKGKIIAIDSDVSMADDGNAYFKVKVEPEKYYLISRDGNKVNLSPGLQTEVRITYDEITYLKYVLDALGVKD
jgi:multidrug efflux pump subunit AcrA (membrane-fusion protein)